MLILWLPYDFNIQAFQLASQGGSSYCNVSFLYDFRVFFGVSHPLVSSGDSGSWCSCCWADAPGGATKAKKPRPFAQLLVCKISQRACTRSAFLILKGWSRGLHHGLCWGAWWVSFLRKDPWFSWWNTTGLSQEFTNFQCLLCFSAASLCHIGSAIWLVITAFKTSMERKLLFLLSILKVFAV